MAQIYEKKHNNQNKISKFYYLNFKSKPKSPKISIANRIKSAFRHLYTLILYRCPRLKALYFSDLAGAFNLKMASKQNSGRDLIGLRLTVESFNQRQSKRYGRRRTVGRDDIAVSHHTLFLVVGTSGSKSFLETGIAGGIVSVEDSERSENHAGSGTYGCYFAATFVLSGEKFAYARVCSKIRCTRHAAGADVECGFVRTIGKHYVSSDFNAVGTFDSQCLVDRHSLNIYACATKKIDSSQSLDFLKAVG